MFKGMLEAIGIFKGIEYESGMGVTLKAVDLTSKEEFYHYIPKLKVEIDEKIMDGKWIAQVDFLDLEDNRNSSFLFLDNTCCNFKNNDFGLSVSYVNYQDNTLYTISAS